MSVTSLKQSSLIVGGSSVSMSKIMRGQPGLSDQVRQVQSTVYNVKEIVNIISADVSRMDSRLDNMTEILELAVI